jgi:phenylacetate-coenzyme A ligase PaaK-like adenylate-forming protein
MCERNPWPAFLMQIFSILSTHALVEALNAFAPTVIATYPTVVAVLADVADQGALHFVPKAIWTGGETLSAAVRQRLERVLGCVVRNSRGASEFLSIAWECDKGHLHANEDWVILEPVHDRGRQVPANELSCSTLLTNLANHVQSLIRYDLGDQLKLHPERCDCGCALPVIEVPGRCDDALLMAGRDAGPSRCCRWR